MTEKNNCPRKVFTVIIHEKEYDVYDIENKEHEGYNDNPKTWWLYYSDRLPEGLIPPDDSDCWKPFSSGIIRRLWDIRIKQINSTKEKWGETNFRNNTSVEMWCNNKLIYAFGTGGKHLDFAMAKIQYLQVVLSEHPYDFFNAEKENGRKIFWYGLPATVRVKSDTWEISVIPDYTVGLSKVEWWAELKRRESKYPSNTDGLDKQFEEMDEEDFNESMSNDYINWGDALSDQHIDWFRK